jgi:hypothetical protein
MRNKLTKKITVVLLALTMVVVGFMPVNGSKVKAAEGLGQQVVEYTDYETYKNASKAPRYSGTESGDYIFAGWFADKDCSSVVADGAATAYAKFVSADILSAACQVKADTASSTATTALRMLSTVDSLDYSKVGFKVKVADKEEKAYNTDTVYKNITALENGVESNNIAATKFDSNSGWFFALTILNISNTDYAKGIQITPYWITLDGTEVTGISRYVRVEDYYKENINVPVRLNSADDVAGIAAGRVTVNYPSNKCTFVAPATGETLDLGMFEEVEYYDDGNGTIKIVGNVSSIANKDAEGLYINLRFTVTDTSLTDNEITVTYDKDHDFCDIDENVPSLKVVRSAYNDFK